MKPAFPVSGSISGHAGAEFCRLYLTKMPALNCIPIELKQVAHPIIDNDQAFSAALPVLHMLP